MCRKRQITTKKYRLQISLYISLSARYNNTITSKGLICVIDEKDAWNSFMRSGSVMDYLQYKSAQRSADGQDEVEDEVQDQGTDNQRTEYR